MRLSGSLVPWQTGDMFYSRPALTPLELDLREIRGDSSGPAQFYGRTEDGRPIDIRYRGGCFSVYGGDIGAPHGTTPHLLLKAAIAPWPNNEMLLEQACDLAGLTVRGERQVLSHDAYRDAVREGARIWDWSGRTTYWVRDLMVTEDAAQRFVDTLAREIGDPVFFNVIGKDGRGRLRILPEYDACSIGFGPDHQRLQALLYGDDVKIADERAAFAHVLDFWGRWSGPSATRSDLAKEFGRPIVVADWRLQGRMQTEFATADPRGRAFVDAVIAIADRQFSNHFELLDMSTGSFVKPVDYPPWYSPDYSVWYSLDLLAWTQAASDRYLFVYGDDRSKPARTLGMRPAARA
jgi:hypothetical protein